MTNKITKREMFTMIMARVEDNADMVSFIQHEIELLDKKAASKKATKTQEQNVGIKSIILEVLGSATNPMTITDIQNAHSELGALSNQKVSALVRQLVDSDEVVRSTDKKKSVFSIA